MIRRAMTSGRQQTGSCVLVQRDPFVDQRTGVGAGNAGLAARKWRSQPKPNRAAAQSSDGGVTSNGERASQTTTLPANTNRPE